MSYARLSDPAHEQASNMRPFFTKPTDAAQARPKMSAARRRKIIFSYAPDWILTIVLAVILFFGQSGWLPKAVLIGGHVSSSYVGVLRVLITLGVAIDSFDANSYALHERVPNIALYFICFVAPLLIQPVVNLFTIRSWWDLHNGTLGLILGLALTGSITQFSKITVGRPRPDIVDRCQPLAGAVDPTFGLSNYTICQQQDNSILRDGFRSFPSGHSSLSFAGLGFLAFYLAGKLHLFDKRGHAGKAWLSLSPFAAAALVAISRTMDYRHHWHDVLIGSLLGTVLAYFSYRQYYPSLASELSHRPYSPRIPREPEEGLPLHHRYDSSVDQSGVQTSRPTLTRRYTDDAAPEEAYELDGTVQRHTPPLEEVWREGASTVVQEAPAAHHKPTADPIR
ncbi:phosphatidic acid phosphatase type 2/haloperoxidase [Desarmillaria tabescens]|uniref:Phosphatidic acid phosphatase type 2/haloperoxidase n=1 Tax=Armillaria tabescens TaxID=1929756 RepID=A0AA39N6V8_ARMTA|nr:phosphatidic acid phosphatase type 2/haloperoxidase [Desarmillaria tabescens]KAK0459589.1 phosphatidic acid phosphatase type 2/haloperoxidase [Desarmillaria tabescens]